MNLVGELARTGAVWCLEPVDYTVHQGRRRPARVMQLRFRAGPHIHVPITKIFASDSDLSIETMLVATLREHVPSHPVLHAWYSAKGYIAVELEPHARDTVDGCVRAALRSQVDSKQSVLTWNALHLLHPEDASAVWDEIGLVLQAAFADGKKPLRRALAKQVSEAIVTLLQKRRRMGTPDTTTAGVLRDELQEYALLNLLAGCELTSIEEWMWGWLGFLVKDTEAKPRVMQAA
jgi:hypothetical protein